MRGKKADTGKSSNANISRRYSESNFPFVKSAGLFSVYMPISSAAFFMAARYSLALS
jgi:hypothetical protein